MHELKQKSNKTKNKNGEIFNILVTISIWYSHDFITRLKITIYIFVVTRHLFNVTNLKFYFQKHFCNRTLSHDES